jgi:purine-binding chemotaxis protein CheW
MTSSERIVAFSLDEKHYGIPLAGVEKVVRMVEITPLPAAPEFIRGVINVQGEIMPVLDLRCRFGLPARPVETSDQLIILRCRQRSFALMAEGACEVRECPPQMLTAAEKILPHLPFFSGVAKLPDGLILLSDPEVLLSPGETAAIDKLLAREEP